MIMAKARAGQHTQLGHDSHAALSHGLPLRDIGPESVSSATCQKEIAHAAANNKRLIPILHRYVPDEKIPEALTGINWIFLRNADDFESNFASLIDALETDLDWKRTHTRLLKRCLEWETWKQGPSALQVEYIQVSEERGPASQRT
jgi:hypothetical protein